MLGIFYKMAFMAFIKKERKTRKSVQILNLEEENFYYTVDSSRSDTNFEDNDYDIQ